MVITLFSMFILLLSLSAALIFLFMEIKSHWSTDGAELPPGKMGWPLVGETLEFLKAGRRGVPEKFFTDRIQKFSSQIFKTSLLGDPVIVFCGAPANKFLFSNENNLVMTSWPRLVKKIFSSVMQSPVREESLKFRKSFSEFLKVDALKRYIGTMDTLTKQHIKASWENQKDVMTFRLAKTYTLLLACKIFMSIDDPNKLANLADLFSRLASGMISIPINLPGTSFNKAIKAANLMRKSLSEIVKQRMIEMAENKSSPTQDFLSHVILTSDEDGQFQSEMEIADKMLGFLFGAHETTSHVITFVVKYLAELPHVYNKVFDEQVEILNSKPQGELLNWDDIHKMRYSWNVVCEVMRLAPPSQGTFKEVITGFTYAGFSIPKGWMIYWSTNSTHKNSDYFPDPEKFDPSRFEGNGPAPYTYVPFGGGSRICPGREYARLEILVFMHNLVTKFKWEKMIPDEKIIVSPWTMSAKGLPIRLQSLGG